MSLAVYIHLKQVFLSPFLVVTCNDPLLHSPRRKRVPKLTFYHFPCFKFMFETPAMLLLLDVFQCHHLAGKLHSVNSFAFGRMGQIGTFCISGAFGDFDCMKLEILK
ncbi:hypothetical protein MTR67_045513 [Solanum verrucosum]|uniref:Uncharacterized protein n=1 Tax=Solanum verrucosum TaxID=315347 RepID=A0AAF0ZW94_SOLVR|nr:hypothetical protein MTR67_045513 [Solanum verrucosum]